MVDVSDDQSPTGGAADGDTCQRAGRLHPQHIRLGNYQRHWRQGDLDGAVGRAVLRLLHMVGKSNLYIFLLIDVKFTTFQYKSRSSRRLSSHP